MVWKPYYIDNEITIYDISEYGDIKNTDTGKILKPYLHSSGYLYIDIYHKKKRYTKKIHRMVAETYIPVHYVGEEIVNHEDGIKTHNHYKNLKWCTHSYNTQHAYDNGLLKQKNGTNHVKSKFSKEDIIKACDMISKGILFRKISQETGISVSTLQHIRKRRLHADLSKDYVFPEVIKGQRVDIVRFND